MFMQDICSGNLKIPVPFLLAAELLSVLVPLPPEFLPRAFLEDAQNKNTCNDINLA